MTKEGEIPNNFSLRGKTPFAEGCDSRVYALEDRPDLVLKAYHMPTRSQVEYYAALTRRAARMINQEQWTVDMGLLKGKYRIEVVPIDKVVMVEGEVVGIARRVDGNSSEEIVKGKTESWLPAIWRRMEEGLSVEGLHFSSVNYKKDHPNRKILVTDLCDDIIRFCELNNIY